MRSNEGPYAGGKEVFRGSDEVKWGSERHPAIALGIEVNEALITSNEAMGGPHKPYAYAWPHYGTPS